MADHLETAGPNQRVVVQREKFIETSTEAFCRSLEATTQDYMRIFTTHLKPFYFLSFLLTANERYAERCVLEGLQDCLEGPRVLQDAAHCWAKHSLVRSAIRIVSGSEAEFPAEHDRNFAKATVSLKFSAEGRAYVADVLALPDEERFAFVVSVLERMSDPDCASVLETTVRRVKNLRFRAFKMLGKSAVLRRATIS